MKLWPLHGHSILLGGPGLECLHPAVCCHITCQSDNFDDMISVQDMVSVHDIPRHAGTRHAGTRHAGTLDMVELIEKVSA